MKRTQSRVLGVLVAVAAAVVSCATRLHRARAAAAEHGRRVTSWRCWWTARRRPPSSTAARATCSASWASATRCALEPLRPADRGGGLGRRARRHRRQAGRLPQQARLPGAGLGLGRHRRLAAVGARRRRRSASPRWPTRTRPHRQRAQRRRDRRGGVPERVSAPRPQPVYPPLPQHPYPAEREYRVRAARRGRGRRSARPAPSRAAPAAAGAQRRVVRRAARWPTRAPPAGRRASPHRPGLGTEFGEAVHSPIHEVNFVRANASTPRGGAGRALQRPARACWRWASTSTAYYGVHDDSDLRGTADPFPVSHRRYAPPPAGWRR